MAYVVSLVGYVPPARFDGVAWSTVVFEEAPAPDGPWAQIDDQALVGLDPDPAVPKVRDLTTAQATLAIGWYRLTFRDTQGGQSAPSDPERSGSTGTLLPPAPDDVRNASPLLRKTFPPDSVDPYASSDLRNAVYQAVAAVQAVTWRIIDPTLGCAAPEGYACELTPAALVPTAIEAITRIAERISQTAQVQLATQLATGRRLRGFNAGPYSESYFAPGEFARRGVVSRPAMDPDDVINDALWALATEDAKDYYVWRQTGMAPPTGSATSFDYRRQSLGYVAGLGGGLGRGGPDGF